MEDEAVRAFKRKLIGGTPYRKAMVRDSEPRSRQAEEPRQRAQQDGKPSKAELRERKAAEASQSALERQVGRRLSANPSLAEQIERFPMLKDAPRVRGLTGTSTAVQFAPLGKVIRNVRCMRCAEWGHQSGDRECALRSALPEADAVRASHEDPMAGLLRGARSKQHTRGASEGGASGARGDGAGDTVDRAAGEAAAGCGGDGGGSGGGGESSDPEGEFLASLSRRDKKLLLRQLRHREDREEPRKRRRHKRAGGSGGDGGGGGGGSHSGNDGGGGCGGGGGGGGSSSSSSSSSSSDSDSDSDSDDSSHRKRKRRGSESTARSSRSRKSKKKKRGRVVGAAGAADS